MKTLLKKLLILIAILLSSNAVANLAINNQASAADYNYSCRHMLGLTSWDCGLPTNGNPWQGDENITNNVLIIATNVFNDVTIIAAYLVLGYVIYGGYLYMFAYGDTAKTANGKKTLTHAFIGLAIVMTAKIIVSTLHLAFIGSYGAFNAEVIDADALVDNFIGWIIGFSGIVATVFVIIGAIGYITSTGDPTKLQKAKNTIIYALIGLAIVGLAQIITSIITQSINNAVETSHHKPILIAKELSNEK